MKLARMKRIALRIQKALGCSWETAVLVASILTPAEATRERQADPEGEDSEDD